jgi:hypothetical protein
MVQSPEGEYLASGLTGITDEFASFTSGHGSGDCYGEYNGKYYYLDNKVVIDEICGGCMDQERKCNEVGKVYE